MATDTHRYPVEGKPTSNLSIQDGGHSSTSLDSPKPSKAPWWSIFWDYDPEQTAEERAFVRRLDFAVLTILSLGYFIKNLDQTNISNAFVSGMKEDLNMYGNQINLADTAWTVGYVVGQIPSQIILTKIRPSIWIPSCELVWSVSISRTCKCLRGTFFFFVYNSNQILWNFIALNLLLGRSENERPCDCNPILCRVGREHFLPCCAFRTGQLVQAQ